MGKLGLGGRIVRRILGGRSARAIAGQRRLATELTLAINNVLKVGDSCHRAGSLFRRVQSLGYEINLAGVNRDLSEAWLNRWISRAGQGAEASLSAQTQFAEKVKNLKEGLTGASKNFGGITSDARELSNSAKGIYGEGFSEAQLTLADQLYDGAEGVWKVARTQKEAVNEAVKAVGRVEDLLKETPPNLGAIREAWDVTKIKVDAVYTANEQMAEAGKATLDAGKQLYKELPPQLINGTILAGAAGVDHGDYRPELPPPVWAPAQKAAVDGLVKGLEAAEWVETTALNIGGTVVTGAGSLVTGGQVPIVTDAGHRINKGLDVLGELSAKVIHEDGKKLDKAFDKAQQQTAGFLDQVDRDALSGGKAWLGL